MEQYFAKCKSFSLEYGYDLDSYYVSSARFYRDIDLRLCYEYGRFFYHYLNVEQDLENAGKFYHRMEKLRRKKRGAPAPS